ncbi:MAG TPA: LTA synthase family protein, partial [Burkholderiales bacterium]|nr:LTA synthase family protein [Burkholderiales bacterium]
MILAFLSAVAVPLAAGAVLSFLIEVLLDPVPVIFRRPWRAAAVHLGLWTLAFAGVLLVVQRPWFAALLVLAELLFLAVVNNAKVKALREPFVFQDFEYFTDVLKHPRLILPYLGIGRALAVVAAFAAAIYLGLTLEAALPPASGWAAFGAGVALLAAAGAVLLWIGTPAPLPVQFRPADDLRRFGQLASLWYYGLAERGKPTYPEKPLFTGPGPGRPAAELPNIVVVQSESFFDARRLHGGVRPGLLEHFDAARAAAVQHGLLQVPAWGGNTARSEFSFLTGLGSVQLGINLFNPYRKLAQQRVPTLAAFLRRAGYRTVCVHPYPISFYSRDSAYPALGFDAFYDLEEFEGAERHGPYVSDQAVAAKLGTLLDDLRRPLLLFAITMENHGPLHLERVAPGDIERLYATPPPAGYDDLTVYLRHLVNADRMIGALRERLEQSPRDGWLCWYGDHVPILQKVYDATQYKDGRTDYFIWGKGRPGAG